MILEKLKEGPMAKAVRDQINEFGRTPRQLFSKPHVRRKILITREYPTLRCFSFSRMNSNRGIDSLARARRSAKVLSSHSSV